MFFYTTITVDSKIDRCQHTLIGKKSTLAQSPWTITGCDKHYLGQNNDHHNLRTLFLFESKHPGPWDREKESFDVGVS